MESKTYQNNDITVTWEPSKCIHSAVCFKGLPKVFNPKKKPWISLSNSDTETIVNQVKQCPSGAISFERKAQAEQVPQSSQKGLITIKVTPSGPLLITGNFILEQQHQVSEITNKTSALCRCGNSKNKPWCDGSHLKHEFDKAGL